MKIDSNRPLEGQEINLNAQKVARSEAKDKTEANAKMRLTDRVEISEEGKEAAELMAVVNQLPEVRADKVNAIKEAIEAGSYNIDPSKIAEKILNEL